MANKHANLPAQKRQSRLRRKKPFPGIRMETAKWLLLERTTTRHFMISVLLLIHLLCPRGESRNSSSEYDRTTLFLDTIVEDPALRVRRFFAH